MIIKLNLIVLQCLIMVCFANHIKNSWEGHSDIVQPVYDYKIKTWSIFTCRESFGEQPPRLVMFDQHGKRIWSDVDKGHMDTGWAARLGTDGEPVVMDVKVGKKVRSAIY